MKNLRMKSIITGGFAWFVLSTFGCTSSAAIEKPTSFEINKGVNIGNWLSESPLRGERRARIFTNDDVEKLASYGFDHLRLPIDEDHLFNSSGKVDEETLAHIHETITNCKKNEMRVVLDLHSTKSHTFKSSKISGNTLWHSKEAQKQIVRIWKIILDEFEKYSEHLLAYEILNEPTAEKDEQWNYIANLVIKTIREVNKERVIVLGSNRWNYVGKIENLDVPSNDLNIILSFHFYEPLLLTHYEASFNKFANLKMPQKVKYPGRLFSDSVYNSLSAKDQVLVKPYRRDYNKKYFLERWKPAIDFAAQKGLKLYLGEFGCLPNAGDNTRLAWLKDVVSLCREYNIAYSLWEYNNVFGFAEMGTGKIRDGEMVRILTKY